MSFAEQVLRCIGGLTAYTLLLTALSMFRYKKIWGTWDNVWKECSDSIRFWAEVIWTCGIACLLSVIYVLIDNYGDIIITLLGWLVAVVVIASIVFVSYSVIFTADCKKKPLILENKEPKDV